MQSIYEVLEVIRKRPGMYLGQVSIEKLSIFIDGYRYALFQIPNLKNYQEILPLPFELFDSYCESKFNMGTSMGCFRMVLSQCEKDGEKALRYFYEVLDEYKNNASIKGIYQCVLSKENILFHNSNEGLTKIGKVENKMVPIFTQVDSFYYIELSFGTKILFPVSNNVIMKGMVFGLENRSLSGGLDKFMYKNFENTLWEPIDVREEFILDMWNAGFSYGF